MSINDLIAQGQELGEGIISFVNPDRCAGCKICEAMCPYNAITIHEKVDYKGRRYIVTEVNIEACKGCSACSMACPSNVVVTYDFGPDDIMAQLEAVL